MNSYIKPNVNLPISLHDARISAMDFIPGSPHRYDGSLVFYFEDGISIIENAKARRSGKARLKISGIDFDFSYVYLFDDDKVREVSFEKLSNDVGENPIDITYESYGYNLSMFEGLMFTNNGHHIVQIRIYHFGESLYEWETRK